MKTTAIHPSDLRGVFPVPPLARRRDAARSIDFDQNERIPPLRLRVGVLAARLHADLAHFEPHVALSLERRWKTE